MRFPRVTLPPEACAYHCVARTVDKIFFFDTPARKDRIHKIIEACVQLHGAELLCFCIMSNHIHLLVQVKDELKRPKLSKRDLIKIAEVLYSERYVNDLKRQFDRAEKIDKEAGDQWHTDKVLNRYEERRGDLSLFMKAVKERIAHYINKEHNRKGTLWDGRFKSPIVENTLEALLEVAAYIDLNPIRAGLAEKPESYKWCSYAAALKGNKMARNGIAKLYSYRGGNRLGWNQVKDDYRQALFEKGIEVLEDPESGIRGRIGFTAEQVEQEIARKGKLPRNEVLLYRVRCFTDGAIIGTARFVEATFQAHRDKLTSPTSMRKTGPRQIRGANWGSLTALRDIKKNMIGRPV